MPPGDDRGQSRILFSQSALPRRLAAKPAAAFEDAAQELMQPGSRCAGRRGRWRPSRKRKRGAVPGHTRLVISNPSMIPKSGNRFSEKDHAPTQNLDLDPIQLDRIKV
jgi:hypothetical protein